MPTIDDQSYTKLITHLNAFGLELGSNLAEADKLADKNLVYSPLSVSFALAMAYAGARGDTAAEMNQLLAAGLPADTFHAALNRLARLLEARALNRTDSAGNTEKIELNLADALYVDGALMLEGGFLDELARNYDSGVHREDFKHAYETARLHVNSWVADQTHDKIRDLLPEGSVTDQTRLLLVNALYFYGTWLTTFQHAATRDADFHALSGDTKSVPTMHGQLDVAYAKGSDFAVVELPYVGGHLSMMLVLPDEGQFDAVRQAISADWLAAALGGATGKTVRIALPKFQMTVGSFSLKQALQALGLKTAFTDKADFTGITKDEPLQITDVVQKAFIAVDENGTEAAAATAVVVGTTSVPAEIIDFTVDRPFLFLIHNDDGSVLFAGHVVDPSQTN